MKRDDVGSGNVSGAPGPQISRLLASYPRTRPFLPPEYRAIYVEHYVLNRKGAGWVSRASSALETWMHRQVAATAADGPVLEIGAGTLNHLRYEKGAAPYDVVEPFEDLYLRAGEDRDRGMIRRFYADISEVPAHLRYGRVISIATLEHLADLPCCLARSALLLSETGQFQAAIPSEGGLLWGLAWRCVTGIAFRLKTGLPYATIMRHEHLNDAAEIVALCRYFFEDVRMRRFPTPFHHGSFYTYLAAASPRRDRCSRHLSRRGRFSGAAGVDDESRGHVHGVE